jgi:hypothetical protein
MRNLWVKIGLGAGGIFAIGMVLGSVVKFGRHKFEDLVNTNSDIRIPLMGIIPFQLADQRLGDLRRITLLRDAPKHLSGVRIEARLGDSATTEPFKDCAFLTVNDPEHVDGNTRFSCIRDTAGLGSFGTVEIRHTQGGEPTTLVRTLMLPAEEVRQLQEAMGPRVRPDSAKLEELERMGDSLEAMGDSIRAATDVQVRIEAAHGRASRAARGIHVQVHEAPAAPTPPPAKP